MTPRDAERLPALDALLPLRRATEPGDPTPGPALLAICTALVPAASLGADDRARLERDVAGFVAGQLAALPRRFQVLFALGLLGVRALTFLRYGRGIADLPDAARRAWLEAWAYGRLALGRQLFRAVRATALVAYYDHPLVTGPAGPLVQLAAPRRAGDAADG